MKKALALVLALALMLAFAACGDTSSSSTAPAPTGGSSSTAPAGGGDAEGTKTVGISMPTMSLQRWNQDGSNMQAEFEDAGFEVTLQYADNDSAMQVSQVENMIAADVDVVVIAAIDGEVWATALAGAKEKGIPVIAYDRLIMDSDAVTYYATFDNWNVGVMQGQYIADELDLANAEGPFNIEFFTGDPGDNNINFFYPGAMEVLQPYLDSGVLVCPSGQTDIATVATIAWDSGNAQTRMENLITTNGYGPDATKLDAVMCSNDSTAQGVTNALLNAGYTAENFPIITGQDCDIVSVKNMIAGTQSMSVFKDTRVLAASVMDMAMAILEGGEPTITDTETYDNGTGIIPTFVCELQFGSAENYQELLIDSEYYTEEQLAA